MAEKTDSASAAVTSEPKRSWGDEVEDETPEEPSASTTESELNVGGLAIDENKKFNKFLDEPEDSNIKAVRSLSHPVAVIKFSIFIFLIFVSNLGYERRYAVHVRKYF